MKTFFLIAVLMLTSVSSLSVYAVPPQDGKFVGATSQGTEITMEVTNGQVSKIRFLLKPACMGLTWGIGYNLRIETGGDGNFIFSQYLRFDDNSNFLGISPGQHMPVYGFGLFDTPTHASGEIWHAVAYFTGNAGEIDFCLDNSNRFDINYVGPLE